MFRNIAEVGRIEPERRASLVVREVVAIEIRELDRHAHQQGENRPPNAGGRITPQSPDNEGAGEPRKRQDVELSLDGVALVYERGADWRGKETRQQHDADGREAALPQIVNADDK